MIFEIWNIVREMCQANIKTKPFKQKLMIMIMLNVKKMEPIPTKQGILCISFTEKGS